MRSSMDISCYIMNSFGQACTTFVGQNYGAGKGDRCRRAMKLCLLQSFVSTAASNVLILLTTLAAVCFGMWDLGNKLHSRPPNLIVMPPTGYNIDNPIPLIINNAVGFINASAPQPAQVFTQWLRLTNPIKGTSANIFNERIDSFQHFLVLRLPIQIIIPGPIFP